MQNKHCKDVDSLILGIKTILSKNRCSLSEEDKVLLNDAIYHLDKSKEAGINKPVDLNMISKVIEILLKVFTHYDDIKNLF